MNEKLIELVRNHVELYDKSCKHYSDHGVKENIWREIGDELNRSGSDCKHRWSNLRDQYRRYTRKLKAYNERKGSKKPFGAKWRYADEMSFLRPFLSEREVCLFDGNEHAEADEKADEGKHLVAKKRKREGQIKVKEAPLTTPIIKDKSMPQILSTRSLHPSETNSSAIQKYSTESSKVEKKVKNLVDPLDLFFQSMAATVKSFSPYYQSVCKSKVFSVVSEIEMTQILGTSQGSAQLVGTLEVTGPPFSPNSQSNSSVSSNTVAEDEKFSPDYD